MKRPNKRPSSRPKNASSRRKSNALTEIETDLDGPIRLNRYIAKTGMSSRRGADELISQGLVKMNGEVVTILGTKVAPGDVIEVNGRVITPKGFHYILLNKPTDTITTTSDEKGRKTVLDLINLPSEKKKGLYPIGRLDRHTTGVLLLTNDGDLAHRLMHPRYVVEKHYRVRTQRPVKPEEMEKLLEGVMLEDGLAKADKIAYLDLSNKKEIGILLHQGRNRQIRRMLEHLGHDVVALDRVMYAGITTAGVRPGKWRNMEESEIRRLYRLVKLK